MFLSQPLLRPRLPARLLPAPALLLLLPLLPVLLLPVVPARLLLLPLVRASWRNAASKALLKMGEAEVWSARCRLAMASSGTLAAKPGVRCGWQRVGGVCVLSVQQTVQPSNSNATADNSRVASGCK
jgi:hypothetical protein